MFGVPQDREQIRLMKAERKARNLRVRDILKGFYYIGFGRLFV